VSSLDGSNDLPILKVELVANNLEHTLSQGDVNILGEKLQHFGHQVFKVVEPMEGDSHNLQKPMLMSSHCLNLHMNVAQFPTIVGNCWACTIVEAHQGSKNASEKECSNASPEAAGFAHCQSWSLVYSG
jgi:hypothetical protein